MSNIYSIYTGSQVVTYEDEWARIGVHLQTRIKNGMSREEASSSLVCKGIDPAILQDYLRKNEGEDESHFQQIENFYTKEENTIIQQWLLEAPYRVERPEDRAERAARVAEIVLFPIRTSLPQWAVGFSDGKFICGRTHQLKALQKRDKLLEPSFMFQIKWADTGPGICWSESYYLTRLPVYDVFVLTASMDSTDVHGYTDLALSHIRCRHEHRLPFKEVMQAVGNWWEDQFDSYNQCPWGNLWAPGFFSLCKLIALRDNNWKDYSS